MSGAPRKRLGVYLDGAPLPEEEAHAFWDRFSTWMEEHRGDLAGFAASEGFASVKPGVEGDRPVLRASKTAVQTPYATVRPVAAPVSRSGQNAQSRRVDHSGEPGPGGSQTRQGGAPHLGKDGPNPRDPARKRAN